MSGMDHLNRLQSLSRQNVVGKAGEYSNTASLSGLPEITANWWWNAGGRKSNLKSKPPISISPSPYNHDYQRECQYHLKSRITASRATIRLTSVIHPETKLPEKSLLKGTVAAQRAPMALQFRSTHANIGDRNANVGVNQNVAHVIDTVWKRHSKLHRST